jgi:hypothetical protein
LEGLTMTKKPSQERRRHTRYRMKNRIFAVVLSKSYQPYRIESMSKGEIAFAVIKSKPPRMGEIVEISQGGLVFHYLENDRDLSQLSEMDIIFTDDDFHLARLPFKPIKETAIEGDAPFDVLEMRRLAVEFGGLTPKQELQLKHVLKNYTSREGPATTGKQVWGGRS